MRLKIVELLDGAGRVSISSPGVAGSGLWRGRSDPPVGDRVDAEIDVGSPVPWDDVTVDPQHPGTGGPAATTVHGTVLEVDHEGVLALHLDGGGVLLVDTDGDPPLGVVGKSVRFEVHDVSVYPTEL